jgi:hypothetical protein
MTDTCSYCDPGKGFPAQEIAEQLEPNTYTAIQCKYCGVAAIGKTLEGAVKVGIVGGKITKEDIPVNWISLEEFLENHTNIRKDYETHLHEYWSR